MWYCRCMLVQFRVWCRPLPSLPKRASAEASTMSGVTGVAIKLLHDNRDAAGVLPISSE